MAVAVWTLWATVALASSGPPSRGGVADATTAPVAGKQHAKARVSLDEGLAEPLRIPGRVRDEAGQPVAGATVKVHVGDAQRVEREATTGADGRFMLETPPLGPCRFDVEAVGYLDIAGQEGMVVASTRALDFRLKRAAVIHGIVVDTSGAPILGARLWLERLEARTPESRPSVASDGDSVLERPTVDDETTTLDTDTTGRFRFELARPGRFRLYTSAPRFFHNHLRMTTDVDTPAEDLRLVMQPGALLKGTVVDTQGVPVESADIQLLWATTPAGAPEEEARTQTQANGTFFLGSLFPGDYLLRATPRGGGSATTVPVHIEGTRVDPVRLELKTAPVAPLSGIVVDEAGAPLREVFVSVQSSGATESREWSGTARSDARGRFTVKHVPHGPFRISIMSDTHTLLTTPPTPPMSVGGEVAKREFPAGTSEVRLVLRYNGGVRGRVVREDGTPVVRFSVSGQDFESPEGVFQLHSRPAPFRRVHVSAPGLAVLETSTQVASGKTTDVGDLVLKEGWSLRGRVLDERTSAPIVGVTVKARPEPVDPNASLRPLPIGTVTTNPEGAFELPHVAAERLTLESSHPGYLPGTHRLGAGEREATLRMSPAAQLSLTAVNRLGRPVSSADVQLRCEDDPTVEATSDLRDGAGHARELKPCRGYVVALSEGRIERDDEEPSAVRFLPQRVSLPAGAHARLAFREMTGPTTLTLRHATPLPRLPSGEKVALSEVLLVPGDVSLPTTKKGLRLPRLLRVPETSHDDTTTTFTALSAGQYTLLLVGEVEGSEPGFVVHRARVNVEGKAHEAREPKPAWQRLAPGG
ncbi:carboxypeptidase-like regulatory domain-containing protein [Myxococcus sp. K15C18031901]|uniref:carboxypeptidase-like regulatory domain-containing protein n=1 Tax=Myxococcus dinghuensis TaxID=2906761 RepID=UPI0020A77850|nr:carboxypeptidase-like regulatory domain-containing protein [Myxococcus dinghuensis]MCP3099320.1 carboxypeptidase-like regulatory domain-containing protein [Myxococcus dinghuensis]